MEIPKNSYPLAWPLGWKRTQYRSTPRFEDKSIAICCEEIRREMSLLGASSIVISCNLQMRLDGLPYSQQRQPQDPGVAVYFKLNKQPLVLACDSWAKVEHNLWAIVKHINALRGQKRWGVGSIEMAFTGYKALPQETAAAARWRQVLDISIEYPSRWQIDEKYRSLCKIRHPDAGGTHELFIELQKAYEQACREVQA